MSGCIDRKIGEMLHAYEVGMLNEQEQRLFEVHLLDCEHCYETAQKNMKVARIIRQDKDFHQTVVELAQDPSEPLISKGSRRKFWRSVIPTSLAAIIIFSILIFKPWNIQITPELEAYADNRLTIMYFDNVIDPDDSKKLGEIATNLLISDLSESQFIQVLSSQRLYDIVKLLEYEGSDIIGKDVASKVAVKGRAKWLLTGSILQVEPNIVITSQLVEISTSNVIASQKISGKENEDIFQLVDQLTVKIRNDLVLPKNASLEVDRMISDVTTHSQEAYEYYLKGVDYYNRFYRREAAESFETVIEYDSTFAMAYYYLAYLNDPGQISKALKYSDKASSIDQYYIKIYDAYRIGDLSQEIKLLNEVTEKYPDEKRAYYLLGTRKYSSRNYEESIEFLNRAVEIDPLYKSAFNLLAYAYNGNDDFENAIKNINKYIELAPDEANPYDSRAAIYAENGYLDESIKSYKRALEIKPDFMASIIGLGTMCLFSGDFSISDSCFLTLLTSGGRGYEISNYLYRSYSYIFQGKFNKALMLMDSAITLDKGEHPSYNYIKAGIFEELENWEASFGEFEKAIDILKISSPDNELTYRYHFIQVLAKSGNFERANNVAEKMKKYLENKNLSMKFYWFAQGAIETARGNSSEAVLLFEKVDASNLNYFVKFAIAKSYLLAGDINKALLEFTKIKNEYSNDRAFYGIFSAKVDYYMGLAYEESKDYNNALYHYGIFLKNWGNADFHTDLIDDAKQRVAKIKAQL